MGMNEVHFFAAAAMAMWLIRFGDAASDDVAARSVLAALLESPKTEMMELVERAGLLQEVERAAMRHNLTILAPPDEFLEQHFDAGLRDFLLQPPNLPLLQRLVLFHFIPRRITASEWSDARLRSLSGDKIHLHWRRRNKMLMPAVERSGIVDIPDLIVRPDGAVHGIRGLLVPKSVRAAYSAARIGSSKNVKNPVSIRSSSPGTPLSAQSSSPASASVRSSPPAPTSAQSSSRSPASARFSSPAPASARFPSPAPAPAPCSGDSFDAGEMFAAMVGFGGYGEAAALLVNLTSISAEIGSIIRGGGRVTVLAPGDAALDRLSPDGLRLLLRDAGSVESVLRYHILAEYQTEESLYNLVRSREGVAFRTLLNPDDLLQAEEIDGTVRFGSGEFAGLLMDANVYVDDHRRVSVQGISSVLFPPAAAAAAQAVQYNAESNRKLLR